MLKVLELFAGLGACSKALTNLGIEHEIVDAVEIDKYAIKSFNAIHGTNFEPQDITKWDKDIECDLVMHGSPCQDFSVAGRNAGGDKDSGTRSSLMYETLRIVEKLKPKYVIWENVKNLISKKHRHNFDAYIEAMNQLGYHSQYQVLNAKDYGVPQNRERVFTVSIRNDLSCDFKFPEPIELKLRLKDVLEPNVDEKYYLDEERLAKIKLWENRQIENGRGFRFNVKDGDDIATANTTNADRPSASTYYRCKQVAQIYGFSKEPNPQAGRVYDTDGISPTMDTCSGGNRMPKIVAQRGRSDGDWHSSEHFQRLEPREDGLTNTLSSVAKDNYVAEPTIVEDFYKSRPAREYKETAPTLRADRQGLKVMGGVAIRTANKVGYDMATDGDSVDLSYPESKTKRGRVGHEISKTLMAADCMGTIENYRIRKLTPKECWRLMSFSDEDFEKAKASGVSNSQLYKQAGNSIVVKVLEGILRNLLTDQ